MDVRGQSQVQRSRFWVNVPRLMGGLTCRTVGIFITECSNTFQPLAGEEDECRDFTTNDKPSLHSAGEYDVKTCEADSNKDGQYFGSTDEHPETSKPVNPTGKPDPLSDSILPPIITEGTDFKLALPDRVFLDSDPEFRLNLHTLISYLFLFHIENHILIVIRRILGLYITWVLIGFGINTYYSYYPFLLDEPFLRLHDVGLNVTYGLIDVIFNV